MRLFIGGLILIGLFAIASLWQARWTRQAQAERDAARAQSSASSAQGWPETATVTVGRPSGAEPVEPPPPAPPEPGVESTQPTPPVSPPVRDAQARGTSKAPVAASDTEHVVAAGQNLSTIAKAHYGSARKELVDALAAYNKLADPGSIRSGQKLLLPALDKLGLKAP